MTAERRFMERALRLARRGLGFVSPNPPVGAVVVRDGDIVGQGWHRAYGELHAEAMALAAAGDTARGADVYCTLEPCGHQHKQPPCAEALSAAGVARVFYGVDDPYPQTRGVGPKHLTDHGIEVHAGLCEREARHLAAPFFRRVLAGRPLVTCKWAMTLDGRIATTDGDSKWISSEVTRRHTRRRRGTVDAILVGRGTADADDPKLTCDVAGRSNPLRVVLDSQLGIDTAGQLVRTVGEAPLLVVGVDSRASDERRAALERAGVEVAVTPGGESGRVDVSALLDLLGERGICHLLVEGGAEVHGAFFDAAAADRLLVVVGSTVAGGAGAPGPIAGVGAALLARAPSASDLSVRNIGPDLVIEANLSAAGRGEWDPDPGGC